MALRIRMGQYLPRDSRIHRLDPRAKLACALAVMVTVFFIQTPLQLALGLAFALVVVALSKVPLRQVAQSIRPLVVLLCVLGLFNLFYVGEGATLFSLGPVRVTSMGLWWAVCYPLRFTIAILMGALILLTTTPTQLTDAFEACLSPLSRVGLPGHELAMVFSLMLRFIPTIADEASAILDAQTARGGAVTEGSFAHRVRAIGPVLVALLASSAHHAEGLSRALDARGYEGGSGRTHWHPLRMRRADWLACAVCAAYVAALLALVAA